MKILAFGATNSSTSINKQLAAYAANLVAGAEVEVLDLNDYPLPLFSTDIEAEIGKPEQAQAFFNKIGEADAVVISYAEHNGSYTAAFKNLFDWMSRIDMKVYQGKPMIVLSTSPGPGGAKSVLAAATGSAPFFNADLKGSLSVPSFFDNFDVENQVLKNEEIKQDLIKVMSEL